MGNIVAHLPGWLAYPLLPLFIAAAIGMFVNKRREVLWFSLFVLSGLVLYRVDYESLGLRGDYFNTIFLIVALAVAGAWRIQRFLGITKMLSMDANDWQKEFDEANRSLKRKGRNKEESNG